jgi:hypothetical protein
LYADRWTLETALPHLPVDLACEVETLGYPQAALLGFCVALVAYHVGAGVKGARRGAHGVAYVAEQLAMSSLTLEVAQGATGMEIALGTQPGASFQPMSTAEFAATLVAIAKHLDTEKYTKQKTTPAAEKIYEVYATQYIKRAPEATPAAIQTILEELSASRPLPAGITPQRFAESRFVRDLVSSGFIDSLYKSR